MRRLLPQGRKPSFLFRASVDMFLTLIGFYGKLKITVLLCKNSKKSEAWLMIYTEKTRKALDLCFRAHKDQTDKAGAPYVFHPFYVADRMTDEATTVTALLHDIVKNTDYTFEQVLEEGFDEEVVNAIRLLTHPNVDMTEEAYMEYIEALKQNPIARAVKIADLEHNSDLSRYGTAVKGKDIMRVAKYQKALVVLQ